MTWKQSGLIDFVVVVRHRVKMYLMKAVDTLGPHMIEGVAENIMELCAMVSQI